VITVALTYFKSLTLANLAAALYSVSRQDLSRVAEIIVVDNDTADPEPAIQDVIAAQGFPVPVRLVSTKHGDPTREQAWSTNFTVRQAQSPWVLYTRADYLLDFSLLAKFVAVIDSKPAGWEGFLVSHGCHLAIPIGDCEQSDWRTRGPRCFRGIEYDYTEVDSGVWMAPRAAYDRIGGFDERLSAWGHAQTEFQYRMYLSGVEFVRLRETLFFHPHHGGAKDIERAHAQLNDIGFDRAKLQEMWSRYEGPKFY
jgi:GT2 family glycosyltransferase